MKNASNQQRLYETAKRLFLEEGYSVGNRRIAAEASVSLGLLPYHFGSKRNVAIAILKEDYTILSAHLKNYIRPEEDILLYILCFTSMTLKIREQDPKMARFTTEIMRDDVLEASVHAGNQIREYMALIKLMQDQRDPHKNLCIVLGTVFGIQRSLQWNINAGLNFDYDEYFEYMVHAYIFALRLPPEDALITKLTQDARRITDQVFKAYPHLLRTETYLYTPE